VKPTDREEWFTVVRMPLARARVLDSVLTLTPVEASDVRERVSRLLRLLEEYEGVFEVIHRVELGLLNYINLEEPVKMEISYIGFAVPGLRKRSRMLPVLFKIVLRGEEREFSARANLEMFSRRAQVHVLPGCIPPLCGEYVEIEGRRYVRPPSLFGTIIDPFVEEPR